MFGHLASPRRRHSSPPKVKVRRVWLFRTFKRARLTNSGRRAYWTWWRERNCELGQDLWLAAAWGLQGLRDLFLDFHREGEADPRPTRGSHGIAGGSSIHRFKRPITAKLFGPFHECTASHAALSDAYSYGSSIATNAPWKQ